MVPGSALATTTTATPSATTVATAESRTPALTGPAYYVSSSQGDDSRTAAQAQNSSTPWRTIARVNAQFPSLRPGEAILFKRGEVFDGTLRVAASGSSSLPIIVSAYGSGAKPVINGLTPLASWTALGNGLYESALPLLSGPLNLVSFNGALQPMGRWPKLNAPNGGYLTLDSHAGTTAITSSGMSSAPNFVGGEVVIRKYSWILDRATVTSQTSNTVGYAAFTAPGHPTVTYQPIDGHGFFFQNHANALSGLGDWYYDTARKKLVMHFGGATPAAYAVKVPKVDTLVDIAGANHVRFVDLALSGSNARTVSLAGATNIKFEYTDISYSGVNAIHTTGTDSSSITLTRSTISKTLNNAIEGASSTNWLIQDNVIDETAQVRGMGVSGDGQYIGMSYIGSNSTIEYNEVRNTGYIGIHFTGNNVLVKNNLVDTYCTATHDGGAIYAYGERDKTNRKVIGNIAVRGIGDRNGLVGNAGNTHGIYMDGGTRNVEISGNTSALNDASGLELNDADNVQVQNNVFFGNAVAQMFINDRDTSHPVRNLQIIDNVFFAAQPQQLIAFINSSGDNLRSAGTINSNVYARPSFEPAGINTGGYSRVDAYFTDGGTVYDQVNGQLRFLSLDAWQGLSGQDALTVKTQGSVATNAAVLFEYNASKASRTVPLVGSYVDPKGRPYTGSVTLAPYTSVVLIRK